MSIVQSIIVSDSPQKDGRRYIRERHTDHVGVHHECVYLAEAGADANVALANRVAVIVVQLEENEHSQNINRALDHLMPVFIHTTAGQFRTRLRELFKTLSGWDAVRMGAFIHSLSLTDNQLKSLFGVNDAQLPTLKTKLSNAATRYADVQAEAGV